MFGFNFIGKNIEAGVNFIVNINSTASKVVGFGAKLTDGEKLFMNSFGAVSGGAAFGKGVVDTVESVACNDGICATVSGIGCVADGLQIAASMLPGPNITTMITAPISFGCKTFVWCCKRSKFPWRTC